MSIEWVHPLLKNWTINNQVDVLLLDMLPPEIWPEKIPGYDRKTIRMIGAHLHNARCSHIRHLGRKWKVAPPEPVDNQRITTRGLITALNKSHDTMFTLLETGMLGEDKLPGFGPGAVAFMHYMIAHEAHHRGQLLMAARQLGYPVPVAESGRLWQWTRLEK
jgi:hypothetical protein